MNKSVCALESVNWKEERTNQFENNLDYWKGLDRIGTVNCNSFGENIKLWEKGFEKWANFGGNVAQDSKGMWWQWVLVCCGANRGCWWWLGWSAYGVHVEYFFFSFLFKCKGNRICGIDYLCLYSTCGNDNADDVIVIAFDTVIATILMMMIVRMIMITIRMMIIMILIMIIMLMIMMKYCR